MDKITTEQLNKKLETREFEMYTDEGNEECRKGVQKIFDFIRGDKRVTEDDVQNKMNEVMKEIAKTHGEVWDTEPHYHIRKLTQLCCEEVGYNFDIY